MDIYRVSFFFDPNTRQLSVQDYLNNCVPKDRAKILKYIEFLREHKGILDEPYTKHIQHKIRELRVGFGKNRHRIFFFTFVNKNIILLHAFLNAPRRPQKLKSLKP